MAAAEVQPSDTNLALVVARPLTSVWPLVALQGMGININPSCGWTMDTDMVLGSNPGLDITMVPAGSAGHLDGHGPHGSMVLEPPHAPSVGPDPRHPHCLQWQQEPRTSQVLSVAQPWTQIWPWL